MDLYGNGEKVLTDKNLNIGVRNYVLDSAKSVSMTGTGENNKTLSINSLSKPLKQFTSEELSHVILSFNWSVSDGASGSVEIQFNDTPWDLDGQILKIDFSNVKSGRFCKKFNLATKKYYGGSINATGLAIKQDRFTGTFTADHIKLEIGDVPTQWCPAPEDLAMKSYLDSKVNTDRNLYFLNADHPLTESEIFNTDDGQGRLQAIHQRVSENGSETFGGYDNLLLFGGDDTTSIFDVNTFQHQVKVAAGATEGKAAWSEFVAWKSDIQRLEQEIADLKKQIGGSN